MAETFDELRMEPTAPHAGEEIGTGISLPQVPSAPSSINVAGAIADLEAALERIDANAFHSAGGAVGRIAAALAKLQGGSDAT